MSGLILSVVLLASDQAPVTATRETLADAIVTLCDRSIAQRDELRSQLQKLARARVPASEKKSKAADMSRQLAGMASIDPARRLPMIAVEAPRIGQVGELGSIYPRQVARVLQVIGDSGALIEIVHTTLYATGIDTTNLADGAQLDIRGCWEVAGKKSYSTVAAGQRTVFEVRKFDASAAIAEARRRLGDRLNDSAKQAAPKKTR